MDSILNYESIVKVLFLFVPILIYYKFAGRKKFKDKFNSIFSDNNEHLQITTNLFILIEIAIWVVIVLAFWDIFLVHQKVKDFGQWGDFFGGILNPILTFLTFVGLMITIILQQIELKESRVEFGRTADALNKQEQHMQIQGFENTFFKMLELHNNIVENLKFYKEKNDSFLGVQKYEAEGREVFEKIFEYFFHTKSHSKNIIKNPLRIYNNIQKQNHILGQYFRNLYQILKFIKENEKMLNKDLSKYSNILRSQLSSYELLFLFLNCFKSITDKGQFQELLIRYAFLQHFSYNAIEKIDTKIPLPDYYFLYKDIYPTEDKYIKILLQDGYTIYIGYLAFCQYSRDKKSAFDGSSLVKKIDCN
jgi:hypothetical protein